MFTVAPHCQIMEQLGLKGLAIYTQSVQLVFFLYLILYACVQIFDVIG